ncbi:putative ribonuclease H-like domain-containing protein, partial [Tanacetum coccineum]
SSVSTATTPYVSTASTPIGANAGASSFVYLGGKIPIDASTLPNADLPIDLNMPDLEDDSDAFSNDGIFNGAYDDENVGAVANFNNMDDTINVSTIPILRIHKDHPKDQILGDPKSAIQTRRNIQKASSAQQALEEGIDYDEVFAPVASAFLYDTIEEEVYVHQPPGFVDHAYPNKVYKVIKALYGLHQAPRAWYETLSSFLMENGFRRVKQQPDGIFISQDKYVADILKKFEFWSIRTATTPIKSNKPLVKDEDGEDVDVHVYRSMIGSLIRLISWQRKKQTIVANSTTEAEYVAAANCCGQLNSICSHFAGKPISISKASIRSDLQFNNAAGIDVHLDAKKKFVMHPRFILVFLTNQLKDVPVPLDHFPINALSTKDAGEVSERPSKTQPTPSPIHPSEDQSEPQPDPSLGPFSSNLISDSILEGFGGNHGGQSSSDRSQSGTKDDITLQSVYDLYVSLCTHATTQAAQIKDLKAQIKKLKKKAKLVISHHNAWIKSVSIMKRLARKKSLKTKLMQKESVSKQGRKPANSKPTVHKDLAFDDLDDIVDDAIDYMETEDAHNEKGVSTDKQKVSTGKIDKGTDKPKVSTDKLTKGTAEPKDGILDESVARTTVFIDDETIAQVLITMSQNKVKQNENEKGIEFKDAEDSNRPRPTSTRSLLTLKPLLKIDLKDKGKKVLEEEAESDAESEGEAEEEKKKLAEEEATMAAFINEYDFIQARINADKILTKKLQEEEREKFTIEQRAKFLHDTIATQRRFLAQQRSEAIRNKLPTRNQLRNQMMTYLKYVGGYKHAQLNKKKFEEIQVMYEKVKRANENFIPIGSAKDEKLIEKMNKKAARMDKEEVSEEPESTKVKAKIEEPKENIRKRSGRRLKMKAPKRSKRQKTDSDHEEENQLRTFLKIVPEEEGF